MQRGWGPGQPPAPRDGEDSFGQQAFDPLELQDLAARVLRVLLSSESVLLHPQLRLSVLGGNAGADSSSSSRR